MITLYKEEKKKGKKRKFTQTKKKKKKVPNGDNLNVSDLQNHECRHRKINVAIHPVDIYN